MVEIAAQIEVIVEEERIRAFYPRLAVLPTLRRIQENVGFIPPETFGTLERVLGIPHNELYGTATFFDALDLEPGVPYRIRICTSLNCQFAGCHELLAAVQAALAGDLAAQAHLFRVEAANCLGHCDMCPAMAVNGRILGPLEAEEVSALLGSLVRGQRPDQRLKTTDHRPQTRGNGPKTKDPIHQSKIQNLKSKITSPHSSEVRRLLPPAPLDSLPAYVDAGGFAGLREVLRSFSPSDVIDRVEAAGLRGRGGAGFPTGLKWRTAAAAAAPERFVIANADEGEMGTFKDRVLMARNPFAVIEGLLLAAYAIGASRAFIYLRSDYREVGEIMESALAAAREAGYLGDRICGSGFSCDIQIFWGAGSYVCGEETALLESMEGRRGEPRLRPPYPSTSGLLGMPTVVNNVETLANVPRLFADRGLVLRSLGGGGSRPALSEVEGFADGETKLFCIGGDVVAPGVYEMPMGTSLRDLVFGPAGRMAMSGWKPAPPLPIAAPAFGGSPPLPGFKFALVGGAAGRVFTPGDLDMPLDFAHGLSNGAVIVCDGRRSAGEVAANVLEFFASESCGACLPCREGTAELAAILRAALDGGIRDGELAGARLLGGVMRKTSRCGLGQTAPNVFLELLRNFPEEFAPGAEVACPLADVCCAITRFPLTFEW